MRNEAFFCSFSAFLCRELVFRLWQIMVKQAVWRKSIQKKDQFFSVLEGMDNFDFDEETSFKLAPDFGFFGLVLCSIDGGLGTRLELFCRY